jgi:PAS domain S-box-containing protein
MIHAQTLFVPASLLEVWQQNEWRILALLIILGIQAALIGMLLFERANRKRTHDGLRAASKVFDTTGEDYFRSLTHHLNAALKVDYVFVGELMSSSNRMKTLAVSAGGKRLDNVEYDLAHTPCEKVLELGRYFDQRNVQANFPADQFLVDMGFQGYLGVALRDSSAKPIGIMSVMTRPPLKHAGIAELTLDLFAARTAVEIERRRSEQEVESNRSFFEKIAKTMPGVLFVYDLQTRRNVYVNQGGWGILGYSDEEVMQLGDKFIPSIMHPDDLSRLPRLNEQYARAADNVVFKNLFRMKHKTGEYRWILRHATIFKRTADGHPQQLVGTATDITDLKRAEQELQQLSTRLLNAQDQERRRIARDLHDRTAQNIYAIRINLRQLEEQASSPSQGAKIFEECQRLCDVSLQEIRTLSYLLHPPMLDQGGLIPAMRWLVEGFAKRGGLEIQLEMPEDMERLPATVERELFLILQESLANVVRHSGSITAVVHLQRNETETVLEVRDFGKGIHAATVLENDPLASTGVGIASMRERLRSLGGRLEIQSNGEGTVVSALVPCLSRKEDASRD